MSKTLVLGIGNALLSDDGLGIHVIHRLMQESRPLVDVEFVDGGTLGLSLLHYLEGIFRLLIVDAIDMGRPPGTLIRLTGDEVPVYYGPKLSPHEVGVHELLLSAKLCDLYPPAVVVWGIQPASMDVGLDLSPPVADQMDALVEGIYDDLGKEWL